MRAGGGSGDSSGSSSSSSPELSIESLNFSPSQASVGETIHVVDVVDNSGEGGASAFLVDIYLSTDPLVTSADTLIGQRSVSSLASGETSVGSGFLTVPPSIADGTWYVGAIVDSVGTVGEENEANNVHVAFQLLEVSTADAPDLRVNQVTVDLQSVEAGEGLLISDTTENVGVGAATSFQVGIYMSLDATITTGDELIGLRTVPSLGPGELTHLSAPLTVPASLAAGPWFIGALADVGGTQFESDEFNNTAITGAPITVSAPPRPDLRMTELVFSPSSLDAGQSLSISESVINQGLMAADPFCIGIYLSEDEDLDAEDALIGFRSLAGLAIGEGSSASAPLVVPATVGGGSFHVLAMADHEDSLVESDEGNNTIIALGMVEVFVPPMPDLQPVAVSFSPTVVANGESITVIERIENHGVIAATNVRVGFYLSSNEVVSTSDVLLGTRLISSLAVGASDESLSEFVIPNGIATGSWTLGVIADDVSGILEPDEGNNLLVAAGHLDVTGSPEPQADLLVEALSATPSSVISGEKITVQSLVRNAGDLSAHQFEVRFYLSDDEIIESTDHLVGVRTIFQLGIGGGSAQSFPYTVNTGLPLGTYYFGAICDDPNVVFESNEDNNVEGLAEQIEIYVPPPPAPNLTLTAFSFDPPSLPLGGLLQVSGEVMNVGDLDAGTYRVDYYLSVDDEVDASDLLIGSGLTAASLDAGASAPGSSQINLPAAATAGTWYVGGIVTILTGPVDSDTSNDVRVATTTLEVTP